jgi:hypothetical protein
MLSKYGPFEKYGPFLPHRGKCFVPENRFTMPFKTQKLAGNKAFLP